MYGIYIINRAGGLIYQYDHNMSRVEVEKTFSYPLELVLKIFDEKVVVDFGQRDGIKVGHTVLAINGIAAVGRQLEDGRDIQELIETEENYPIAIKFGRPKLTTNEKIMLAGMFHSLFAIASQLSPEAKSSGIQVIETDTFKLHCSQTLTGWFLCVYTFVNINNSIKFMVIADPKHGSQDALLKRLYEIYADYALKNPFYSIDMPIRCELFDTSLQECVEQAERMSYGGV
ncbi:hypothetical protein NP493_1662g00007 [Ridgeia piscesae]|uniref:Trafficking protein particle complex subunit n=1 Tax=Ridgeia piscesae TaxID=27915 RepID=A0AAD9N7N2_RIDPI|nr:hypothetical protein NP493_1662g00007 [Ridgeia piscesae]